MLRLSNRLSAVASLVHPGARVVDVGCDHGYIPAYLVSSGISPSAIACDINQDPLAGCIRLVDELDLAGSITCLLSNGLQNIDGDMIDDIIIAGMGGELIAAILDACPYAEQKHIVVNAMTHPELVRKWLYDHGFAIDNDIIVADGNHYYSVLDAHYAGDYSGRSDIDYFLGNIRDFTHREYFEHLLNYLTNKQKGGADYSRLISIIEEKI